MSSFDIDVTYSKRFIPHMKRIVGEYLISEAPFEEDVRHNTDLVVLRFEALRVACRVRRPEYLKRYPDEFTIRYDRPSGAKSEFAKVIEGWGNHVLYGFADESSDSLCRWTLGDLNVFREWNYRKTLELGKLPWPVIPNPDGTRFVAIKFDALPSEFIVAQLRVEAGESVVGVGLA